MGAATLAGDLLKTVVPCLIARFLLCPAAGEAAAAAAGLGTVLGHNFPVWHRFKGGMGVSCTCAAMFMVQPAAGLLSMIAGMYVVFITKYLSAGAPVIPLAFTVFSYFFFDRTVFIAFLLLTVFMFVAHRKNLLAMIKGEGKKVNVIANANAKFGRFTGVIFLVVSFAADVLLIWYLVVHYS